MPLYEYQCKKCGHEFEEIQKFSDKPIKKCPKCSKLSVEKKVSMTAFALKGEGWYKDGYARPSDKPKEKPVESKAEKPAAVKAETKPAGK